MKKTGVVAFSFGVPDTIRSNRWIAHIAGGIATNEKCPVFTQLDVTIKYPVEVVRVEERVGEPPPTLRIARAAVKWAISCGIIHLHIVAAEPHLWRAERDLKMAIKEAGAKISTSIPFELTKYPKDDWFCSDSTQSHTKSRRNWNRRERILKLTPFWLYKIKCS